MSKIETICNVTRRILYFKEMYPLRSVVKDIVLLPYDYYLNKKNITSVRNVTVAVTNMCNIRCKMCYFSNQLSNPRRLDMPIFRKIIDEIKRSKPCLIISGGEPCTHPDLVEMVDYGKKAGMPVQIFTNGTLVVPTLADKLTDLNLNYINFTLLGDPDMHDSIANVNGAFDRFEKNIAYLSAHRKRTKIIINYTITPDNLHHIDYALEMAKRFNVDGVRLQHYNYLYSCEAKAQEQAMEGLFHVDNKINEIISDDFDAAYFAEKVKEACKKIGNKYGNIPVQWAPTLSASEIDAWYGSRLFSTKRKCMYPWRGILVGADGAIYPCSKIYLKLGDLHNADALSIWNSTMMLKFREKLKDSLYPACARCCKL